MATHPGLHVAPTPGDTGTLPRDARLAQGGTLAPGSTANLSVRAGVLFDNGNPVVSGTAGLAIDVRPCRVVSKFSDGNGPTIFAVSATESPTMDEAPGSGSRIDILYALQPLVTGDGGSGGTSVQPIVGYVAGAASGAPTAPAIPAGAVELGRGTVSAGMVRSNQVVWSKPVWTVANGGIIPDTTAGFTAWNGATWGPIIQDTGWIPLDIASGYSAWDTATYGTPAVRNKGGLVRWRGAIQRTSGDFPTGNFIIARAPSSPVGLRPGNGEKFLIAGENSTRSNPVLIDTDGGATLSVGGSSIPAYVALSGVSYFGA